MREGDSDRLKREKESEKEKWWNTNIIERNEKKRFW
jgi:hypothetical protein